MSFIKQNIHAAEDLAPGFGLSHMGEARFVRDALGAETIGLAHYQLNPGQRIPFGHHHRTCEEIYYVVSGSGRMKLGDEIVELHPADVVFVPPATIRAWEAGDDGMEMLAFGAHAPNDGEMINGWWSD